MKKKIPGKYKKDIENMRILYRQLKDIQEKLGKLDPKSENDQIEYSFLTEDEHVLIHKLIEIGKNVLKFGSIDSIFKAEFRYTKYEEENTKEI